MFFLEKTIFWIQNNHHRYRPLVKQPVYNMEISYKEIMEMRLPSFICPFISKEVDKTLHSFHSTLKKEV